MSQGPESDACVFLRNLLAPMRDGVELALDVLLPQADFRGPVLLNFGPYHKDGRGGRLAVESVHRHFAALGYAGVAADLRGLGNSGGTSPGPFAPGEALDGHDLVEWIAQQPWCDGNVGMWGVSYPGVTALSTAATRPPHLKAIVPIHASADLHRGVVSLGGTSSGFWMRGDWGPRMAAYNLMPPLLQDVQGRWARIWAEHLETYVPWLEAFAHHPEADAYWQSRVVDVARIACPTFSICGWRDLYADCTPRDFAALQVPRRLLMGPWKHEFPDVGKEAPVAGLWEMQRWFERWLQGVHNGIEHEAPVCVHLQGRRGYWSTLAQWPPQEVQMQAWRLEEGGVMAMPPSGSGTVVQGGPDTSDRYTYDPTVGMYSLAWDPWTTALDPTLPRDQSADDARSLCFTAPVLAQPLELLGVVRATLDVSPSVLPLNLVAKLSAVDANGRSTLISTGWVELGHVATAAGQRVRVEVALRATAYRLEPGERLRLAIACADFPRVWPTPVAGVLQLFHGASLLHLPVRPLLHGETSAPAWGPLQPEVLASPHDLGAAQRWELQRDLMGDGVQLRASKNESMRIDALTTLSIDHSYGAAVHPQRPDLAHMDATTVVTLQGPGGVTEITTRTHTTRHQTVLEAHIRVDGQPFWNRQWRSSVPPA